MDTTVMDQNSQDIPVVVDPEVEEMMEAGVHWGHVRSKRHPAMSGYIWGNRSNVEIIDLTQTSAKLASALDFLKQTAREKKLILFVGTRPSARELIRATADELAYPFVNQRWIGGTITNFKVIAKRIETLESLEQEKASGGFEKYTKKERLVKEDEMARLRQNFEGLRRMKRLPDVLIIIDIQHDDLALREATRLGIPVVALTDTNTDPRAVTFAIPSNDDARSAVRYMLGRMKLAIQEGMAEAEKPKEMTPDVSE